MLKKRYPWEMSVPLSHRIKRRMRRLLRQSTVIQVGRYQMVVPDDMAWTFYANGDYYERHVAAWLKRLLEQTDEHVFYDVGANYGYFSLFLADLASRIYAFEPVSSTYQQLCSNIGRNHFSDGIISADQVGLAERVREAEIYLYGSSGKNSLFLRPFPMIDPLQGKERIQLVTLDEWIAGRQAKPPSLIKMDIEGGELLALRGARETLGRYLPVLIIEFEEEISRAATFSLSDLREELSTYPYQLFALAQRQDERLLPITTRENIGTVIALPPSLQPNA